MLSPAERVLRARTAAHTSWANTADRSARTAPGRAGLMKRFEQQVDPDHQLSEADRVRRAESLYKAHFARLALKSVQARRRVKEAPRTGAAAAGKRTPGGEDVPA